MARTSIDLNADLGEGLPWDDPLLDRVTSASVCCGAHAGDPDAIRQTLAWAAERGVAVGAHPGFADREGFGRREVSMTSAEVAGLILDQVEALARISREVDAPIRFVKPHGALYNQAQRDPEVARGVVDAVARLGLPVFGQPGSEVDRLCREAGVRFVAEGFVDRRYTAEGRLVPRTEPNAILDRPDDIRAQVLELVDRGVDTLCVHGDDPRSVFLADLARAALREAGVGVEGLA